MIFDHNKGMLKIGLIPSLVTQLKVISLMALQFIGMMEISLMHLVIFMENILINLFYLLRLVIVLLPPIIGVMVKIMDMILWGI